MIGAKEPGVALFDLQSIAHVPLPSVLLQCAWYSNVAARCQVACSVSLRCSTGSLQTPLLHCAKGPVIGIY